MIEEILINPVELNDEELEDEYQALFSDKLTEFLEDENASKEIKDYFRQHMLKVELEYKIRNSGNDK